MACTHSCKRFAAQILAELPPIKVGFNSVGGEVATDLVRSLAVNGTVITYGGMSKQPVSLPSEIVAQKKIHAQGFWISNWFENASLEEREALFAEIGELIKDEKLSFFYELFDLDDFQYALTKSTEPFKLRKVVLNLDYPDRFAEHDALPASARKTNLVIMTSSECEGFEDLQLLQDSCEAVQDASDEGGEDADLQGAVEEFLPQRASEGELFVLEASHHTASEDTREELAEDRVHDDRQDEVDESSIHALRLTDQRLGLLGVHFGISLQSLGDVILGRVQAVIQGHDIIKGAIHA
eukprot:scaffold4233_cov180-Ochromonas_danica.AAC.6